MITFSYSITEEIVWGIISYTPIKAGSEKFKKYKFNYGYSISGLPVKGNIPLRNPNI